MPSRLWSLPVFRLLATDRCRVAAPWFAWTRASDDTAALRRLALRLERERLSGLTRVESAAAAIGYLPWSFVSIFAALRKWGPGLSRHYGVSRWRQFFQLWAYAWRLGLAPRAYYHLRLHRHEWRRTGRYFIDQPELHHLQRYISPADIGALENKLRFARHAAAHGIPHVPLLTVWREGRAFRPDGAPATGRLPTENIFVKPAAGYSSSGVMAFHYEAATASYRDEHRCWSEPELREHFAGESVQHALLVQPWLENRADLRGFSPSALCNFRVTTARAPDGTTTVLMAAFRFPWQSRISCAEPGITLCASIDLATGTLRAAEAKDPTIGRLKRHPVSGQQIEGFVVEGWGTLVDTAIQAHTAWPEFPFIGWDIALTQHGLCVLEGGPLWGAALAQMSGSTPLGLTPFPQIYLAHLARRRSSSHENARLPALAHSP